MERPEIQRINLQVRHEVDANTRRVRVRRRIRLLEPALVSHRDQMVRVDALNIRADSLRPRIDGAACGVARGGRGARRAGAAGLVRELPGEDAWFVHVATDEGLDVVLDGFERGLVQ